MDRLEESFQRVGQMRSGGDVDLRVRPGSEADVRVRLAERESYIQRLEATCEQLQQRSVCQSMLLGSCVSLGLPWLETVCFVAGCGLWSIEY